MYKIGDFARIANCSIAQLRHYDDIGLFKPQYTDPKSAYRYYSVGQLPELNKIIALKNLGLTLDQVKRMLDERISEDEIASMLRLRRAQIEEQIRAETQQLSDVEHRLEMLRQGQRVDDMPVVVKEMPARPYLYQHEAVYSYSEMLEMGNRIHQLVRRHRDKFHHYLSIFHANDDPDVFIEWEFGIVPKGSTLDLPLMYKELPKTDSMACLVYQGNKVDAGRSYHALGMWMDRNNYIGIGPSHELYVEWIDPRESDQLVVEIQYPVKQK